MENHSVLLKSNDTDYTTSNNVIFTNRDTKLYVLFVSLSKDKLKLSKLPSKGFEKTLYWNEY